MDWTELIAEVPAGDIETAANIAQMTVPYGIYIEDYSNLEAEILEIAHIDLIDDDLLSMDRTKGKIHIYISPQDNPAEAVSFLRERFAAENIDCRLSTSSCDVEACLENWKKYFKPLEVGSRLLIRPIWRNDYEPKGRMVLNLDPGLAFGTGTHETTRLCLEMLEKTVKSGATMLDVGCGSGILSVASLLLGAKSAVGVDIDEMAVRASVENAELNGVSASYTAVHGSLDDKISGVYDIIAANIVADAIIELAKTIETHMHSDTVYIMSGIIDTRLDDVIKALPGTLELIDRKEEKGWICLAAKKKSGQM